MIIATVIMFVIEGLGMKTYIRLLSTPMYYLMPSIIFICFIGAYTATNNIFQMKVLLVFGLMGYFFRIIDMPVAPAIISFVLGPICEKYMRRSFQLSNYSFKPIFQSAIVDVVLGIAVLFIAFKVYKYIQRKNVKAENKDEEATDSKFAK